MNRKTDNKLNLLLKKISNLDSELEDILWNKYTRGYKYSFLYK